MCFLSELKFGGDHHMVIASLNVVKVNIKEPSGCSGVFNELLVSFIHY